MDKIQTLNTFWSSFGIPAFDGSTVPEFVEDQSGNLVKLQTPYITYDVSVDDFGNPRILNANLWYRSSSWEEISQKEQEIAEYITRGGRMLAYDGGAMWIQRGTPWAQRMRDPSDDMMRLIVLTITIEYLD